MDEKLAWSAKETAEILGLSEWKVRELCYTKQLRSLKVGKRLLIPTAALHEFLNPESGANATSSDQQAGRGSV